MDLSYKLIFLKVCDYNKNMINKFSTKLLCALCGMFFLFLSFSFGFASKEKNNVPESINMAVLNGPSGMCFAYLFENVSKIDNTSIYYEVCASPDVLLPKLLKGELDIGILPPNVATKVYSSQPDSIILAAVSGFGMLNLVSTDKTIKSLEDLKGKTVYVAGQGATPEYIFRAILEKSGINQNGENSVTLDFSIPTSELAAAIVSGKVDYAVVPEPFATVAVLRSSEKLKVYRSLDLQIIWSEFFNTDTFPMTTIVVRKEFAKKYPALVNSFLQEAENSIKWTNQNTYEASLLVEKHTLGLKAQIAEKAIPNCAFGFSPAKEAKPQIELLLQTFLKYAPASVGGKLPDDNFYFE